MDISDINNTLRDQFATLNGLPAPIKYVTIFQTIRMGLQMVKSSMKDRYPSSEGEIVESVIHIFDRNLHMLMISGNLIEIADDSSEELSDDEDECKVCNSKEKHIEPEEFSEKNKEHSGWASSITSEDDEEIEEESKVRAKVRAKVRTKEGAKAGAKEEDSLKVDQDDSEPDTPLDELFFFMNNGEVNRGSVEDKKYIKFLNMIAKKNIYTSVPNKLYGIMEMNRESSFDINKLRMSATFKFLIDNDCEQDLIKYYS